ncbi:MAG TPA: hypothetical protein VMF10_15985 [Candidatus Aquilonibacter sp.]|nr:hypothetical protein [Candidatus Aquilonibacter sp.]
MKFATVSKSSISKSLMMSVALLLATTAFAATKASLELDDPVTLNGTTLKPGDYKVQWEGTGPNVELSITQGKHLVAKATAHMVDLPAPAANNAAVTMKSESGPNSLAGIRFQGKKFAFDLSQTSSDAMQGGSSK